MSEEAALMSGRTAVAPGRWAHLSHVSLSQYVARLAAGHLLTGEMLADALEQIEPPLLPRIALKALAECLSGMTEIGRGRPKIGSQSRSSLATRLRKLKRYDVDRRLLAAMIDQLDARRPFMEAQRGGQVHRKVEGLKRDTFLYDLFNDLALINFTGAVITHPIVGTIDRPAPMSGESEFVQKVILAQEFARKLGLDPPSVGRISNIIRERKKLERRYLERRK